MDTFFVTFVVSVLTALFVLAIGLKLEVWQSRQRFWAIIRDALAKRINLFIGVGGVLVYLFVYFVLGNRIHYFYGRLIFTVSIAEVILSGISALLVGLLLVLFVYSLKKLGLVDSRKGGWGAAGTLLAVLVSFCP